MMVEPLDWVKGHQSETVWVRCGLGWLMTLNESRFKIDMLKRKGLAFRQQF